MNGKNGMTTHSMETQTLSIPAPRQEALVPAQSFGETSADYLNAQEDSNPSRQLFFFGNGGTLLGIHVVNFFLTLITLGIYSFWGKVKIRNYQWGQTELEGDRFAYHGTGKELLTGFFKASLLYIGAGALIEVSSRLPGGKPVEFAIILFAAFMMLTLVTIAMIGPWRYRLSRTSWRGIRFSFRGSLQDFAKIYIGGLFLMVITLGLYYPFLQTKIFGFKMSNACFGNKKFSFDGKGKDLFGSFLLTVLLLIPTFGLYWFWFKAKMRRYLYNHTAFGPARLKSTVTGGGLLWLTLTNGLLLIFTLGFAWSWVLVRTIQFNYTYLSLEGPLNLASIQQEAKGATAMGEGLESILDLDSGFEAA
ncbi:MAG TPA: YjgN family protein [Nitrospiria bacterium]|jgi:uncharacterized membrane protein YjgN (DUF898 family)